MTQKDADKLARELYSLYADYRLIVLKRFRGKIPEFVLRDSFDTALIKVVNGKTEKPRSKLMYIMVREVYKALNERAAFKRYVIEGERHFDHLDYKKLDKRFINYLTPIQRKIWEFRIKGVAPKDMGNFRSTDCINVITWQIMRKYKKWKRNIELFDEDFVESLSPKVREVMRLYLQGYSQAAISKLLNKSTITIGSAIFKARHMRLNDR